MSGIALVCKYMGHQVSGSDQKNSNETDNLKTHGITVFVPHDEKNITDDIDLVVYTAAISKYNVELVKARNLGIKALERAVFLGELMKNYKFPIAISGTHGKTTITSMLSAIFEKANLDPTSLIGGNFKTIGGNVRIGSDNYMITEACEYVDSFLNFRPMIAIINNIEEDHLDYFKNINNIKRSFLQFSSQVRDSGFVIACGDNKNVMDTLKDSDSKIFYYGFNDNNDFLIKNFETDIGKFPSFNLYFNRNKLGSFKLALHGRYNAVNAAAAIACAYLCGIDIDTIAQSLSEFPGVNRRFEFKGFYNGNIAVYDDYAHHPTEIMSTLKAASEIKATRLIAVFQPHTYSRTKYLFDKFTKAFTSCDMVIFADIYAAREPFEDDISSKMLRDAVQKTGTESYYFDSFEKITAFLKQALKPNDIVFTVGAGDVYRIGEALLASEV